MDTSGISSHAQGLAKVLQSYMGKQRSDEVQGDYKQQATNYNTALANALQGIQSNDFTGFSNPVLGDLGTQVSVQKALVDANKQPTETFTMVKDPFGRGGSGQQSNISGKIVNYQEPDEPKLPSGMQMVNGNPEWIPGYLEGQSQIFNAKATAGQDEWITDPEDPTIQVNLTTGEQKLTPQTEAEKAEDKAVIEAAAEEQKNQTVFQAFDVGMKNLADAMDETDTGPLVGRLPAVTAKGQTAEGAVSVMAPVLKSMFRSAGEGVFTDKDQDLLMGMIPTRTDHPEARKAKTEMIYAIVRAKLGVSEEPVAPSAAFSQEQLLEEARRRGLLDAADPVARGPESGFNDHLKY